MENSTRRVLIFCLACGLGVLLRLVPFRLPNSEPLLMLQMPLGKRYGALLGFLFGALSIILFDVCSATLGVWTLINAVTYGLLGVAAALWLAGADAARFGIFAIGATLFYDGVTGLLFGPILFGQTMYAVLVGQIPFTMMHLINNVVLAVVVSPALDCWIKTYDKRFSSVTQEVDYA